MTIDLDKDCDDQERYLTVTREVDTVYARVITRSAQGDMWNSRIYRKDLDVIKEAMDLMGGGDA